MLTIFTDGGSRGNPGKAACGFVAFNDNRVIAKGSKYLGISTNNFAEYQGVILALNWLKEGSNVEFFLDSELVVKQLNGIYKIKNPTIQKMVVEIKSILVGKKIDVIFKNVPRSKNKIADGLVNEELDRN